MVWAMSPQNFLFGGEPRLHPDPLGALIQKVSFRVNQPGWPLGMIILAIPGCGFVEKQSEHSSHLRRLS